MKNTYPRPQFKRKQWINLNGDWQFTFDRHNAGIKEKWYQKSVLPNVKTINVPFCVQSELSGIQNKEKCPISWYMRTFPTKLNSTDRIILNVGAIDYISDIYINGEHVKHHQGGHVSFSVDITEFLNKDENSIHIRVFDDMHDIEIPRGKQYWKEDSESIFYTRTSGIWQTIWLETVPKLHIKRIKIIPDILTNSVKIGYYFSVVTSAHLHTEISFKNQKYVTEVQQIEGDYYEAVYYLGKTNDQDDTLFWSPECPNLYDVLITLKSETSEDAIESYFGMRKISIENGCIMLNHRPYFMRLVLDQGYYPKGLLTSPSDDALIEDIQLTKSMGFNGVRKHQKIEEERYLYYADKLGLLVWEEMPSAYKFSSKMMRNLNEEWSRIIDRDFNHPSIIAWVPINESWGVPNLISNKREVHYLEALYHLTKAKDDTRLVISNDGWEHGTTDILTVHDYTAEYQILKNRYQKVDTIINSLPGHHMLYNDGFKYNNEPIMVTEFGGISYQKDNQKGWGYSNALNDKDYEERLKSVFSALYESPHVQGVCYTQLTDIEQEINGLLTFNRQPKIPIQTIQEIVLNQEILQKKEI